MKFLKRFWVMTAMAVIAGADDAPSETKSDHLLRTHWYQDGEFAQFTPNQERVGCWSTAFAQILYFHRLKPSGQVRYECASGKVDLDLDKLQFDWAQFPEEISARTTKESVEMAARYSFATAAVVRKDFGTGGYKRLLNAADDLEAHFPVDAEIYVQRTEQLPIGSADLQAKLRAERITNLIDRAQVITLLKKELGAKRPVYLHFGNIVNFGHSVVIDGVKTEGERVMTHLNYGAREAEFNKWYDLFAPITQADDLALRAFVTVKPLKGD